MTKTPDPVPDGTLQVDDSGRCVFCGGPGDHVHPEPRPAKRRARKTTDEDEE